MKLLRLLTLLFCLALPLPAFSASGNIIEKQLEEIGSIPQDEVIVVQRKYTRKNWRSEFSPLTFGGVPFGTVRRTLVGGAAYTLHFNDWFAWEAVNFLYTKNFFSSFTSDINENKTPDRVNSQADIKPDYQKLLYFVTTGFQITPVYGKFSTFSRWIAYVEPYVSLGLGVAKTEVNSYVSFYPGIGLRAFFREWFSMKVEFRDMIYTESFVDRKSGLPVNNLRNNYAVYVAFSFWLPKMPG